MSLSYLLTGRNIVDFGFLMITRIVWLNIHSFIMAMAVIGGLASKFLPQAISWGVNKLGKTNIGRGLGNMFTGIMKAANSKPAKMLMNAVQESMPKT